MPRPQAALAATCCDAIAGSRGSAPPRAALVKRLIEVGDDLADPAAWLTRFERRATEMDKVARVEKRANPTDVLASHLPMD
jgi:hypothetical protein